MPRKSCSEAGDAAEMIVGRRIAGIDRVLYQVDGVREPGDGPLEVSLDDGSVLLLEAASDGESLRVQTKSWADPFAGEMSPENQMFVAQSGKWTRVPVSDEPPYQELVGAAVMAVEVLENQFGCEAGLAIETAARTLWFVVRGDEAHVLWASPLGYRARRRYIG